MLSKVLALIPLGHFGDMGVSMKGAKKNTCPVHDAWGWGIKQEGLRDFSPFQVIMSASVSHKDKPD